MTSRPALSERRKALAKVSELLSKEARTDCGVATTQRELDKLVNGHDQQSVLFLYSSRGEELSLPERAAFSNVFVSGNARVRFEHCWESLNFLLCHERSHLQLSCVVPSQTYLLLNERASAEIMGDAQVLLIAKDESVVTSHSPRSGVALRNKAVLKGSEIRGIVAQDESTIDMDGTVSGSVYLSGRPTVLRLRCKEGNDLPFTLQPLDGDYRSVTPTFGAAIDDRQLVQLRDDEMTTVGAFRRGQR